MSGRVSAAAGIGLQLCLLYSCRGPWSRLLSDVGVRWRADHELQLCADVRALISLMSRARCVETARQWAGLADSDWVCRLSVLVAALYLHASGAAVCLRTGLRAPSSWAMS